MPARRKCRAVDNPVKPAPITSTSASTGPLRDDSFGPAGVTAAQSEGGMAGVEGIG
jgi:hypothetical protein